VGRASGRNRRVRKTFKAVRMEVREFVESVLETAEKFPWIRRTEVKSTMA